MQLKPHERFKDARTVHNVNGKETMRQVAEATKVPQSALSDLERDPDIDANHPAAPRKAAYQTVAALAQHYGVSADYLLGLSDDPHRTPSAVDELGLVPEAVRHLKEVMRFADREQEPDGDLHRRLSALNSFLSSRRFSSFLTFFTLAEKAAEQTRAANRPFEETKGSRLPAGPVSLRDRDSYSYAKYLCLKQFERMLDDFCQAEGLDE